MCVFVRSCYLHSSYPKRHEMEEEKTIEKCKWVAIELKWMKIGWMCFFFFFSSLKAFYAIHGFDVSCFLPSGTRYIVCFFRSAFIPMQLLLETIWEIDFRSLHLQFICFNKWNYYCNLCAFCFAHQIILFMESIFWNSVAKVFQLFCG